MQAGWDTLTRWLKPRADGRPARRSPTDANEDDRPAACGWYESSWELERGLAVVEVEELELAVWQLVSEEPAGYFSAPV